MKKTKEETPDFDGLLKSMNTGVNKLILINKNIGDVKLGVKNANAKIVNSNLGIKSLNTKLVSIDKNIARLLTSLTNVPTKNKEENYLSEQYQNESLRETKLTNDLLLDIRDSLKFGVGKNPKKDGGIAGVLGMLGVSALFGKKLLGVGGKALGLGVGGAAIGAGAAGAGLLGKGGKLLKIGGKFAGKTIAMPLTLALLGYGGFKGFSESEGDGLEKTLGAAKGALDNLILDDAKAIFGMLFDKDKIEDEVDKQVKDKGGEFGEVLDFIKGDFENIMGNFSQDFKNLFVVPDWLKSETWESLYTDPDKFMESVGKGVNPIGMVQSGIGSIGTGSMSAGKMVAGVKQAASDTDKRAYMSYAEEVAKKEGIDPNVMKGLIQQESGWNPEAVSSAGAIGLTQMLPSTVGDVGGHPEDLFDPYKNIQYGARYLKTLLDRYNGDYNKALTAYHSGMGNVEKGNIGPIGQVYASQVQEKAGAFRELGPVGTGEPYQFAPEFSLKTNNVSSPTLSPAEASLGAMSGVGGYIADKATDVGKGWWETTKADASTGINWIGDKLGINERGQKLVEGTTEGQKSRKWIAEKYNETVDYWKPRVKPVMEQTGDYWGDVGEKVINHPGVLYEMKSKNTPTPVQEPNRTKNMQNKAIEATKDKTSAVAPVINNNNIVANNAGTQNQNNYQVNSDSIFDVQYVKTFLNPHFNKV